MENSYQTLPKNVQKLIKRLADCQRKEITLLRSANDTGMKSKDFEQKAMDLFEKSNKALEDLFNTRFVSEEIGIGWDEEATASEEMHQLGIYFLGIYAMERMIAEASGAIEYNEDLLYAGMLLVHRAVLLGDEDDDFEKMDFGDEESELWEDMLKEASSLESADPDKSNVVQLFGDKKKKK